VKSFKKCCISNGVDGTADMVWSDCKQDGNVRSGCEEDGDNDTDW
jgi:hypothetical protein